MTGYIQRKRQDPTHSHAAVRAYPSGRASGNAERCQARVGAVCAETRYASAWAVSCYLPLLPPAPSVSAGLCPLVR